MLRRERRSPDRLKIAAIAVSRRTWRDVEIPPPLSGTGMPRSLHAAHREGNADLQIG